MGEAFMATEVHNDERRPPENPRTPGQPFDSIFAEKGVGNYGTQKHNEYVVFRGQQCYPEFIVWYKTS
jgi:aminoglycoside phosphotransferase